MTFNEHVAPILLQNCASCHRPGQAGPFPLLTYEDARKRARQIAEVTASRYMPPWLPDPGPFEGERSLTSNQIRLIQRWAQQGALEGDPARRPQPPTWSDDWHLGKPDLVVTMPAPYELAAGGPDVYRNFVVPVGLASNRLVRAIEVRPGSKSVHHAFVRIDNSGESRRLDTKDPEVGFPGMHTPPTAQSPDGFFLSWQPGKMPHPGTKGLAWTLEKNSDLVLQVHMQPVGKPEPVQFAIGLYFTDEPPSLLPMKLWTRSFDIDIPAGASNHVIERSFALAAPVELRAILPHAHYLAREVNALATLPDGREMSLLKIRNWDFNWQGEYTYKKPIDLPKGTRITMRYVYDNSTNNLRNPSHPPQRVRYGIQSADEMAELWLQVLVANTEDRKVLAREVQKVVFDEALAYNQYLLGINPADARAHSEIGRTLLFMNRKAEAESFLRRAIELGPDLDDPHYYLGLMFRLGGEPDGARAAFEKAVSLNPANAKAHGYLGLIFAETGQAARAKAHLQTALQLNPEDQIAREALRELDIAGNPKRP